MVHPSSSAVRVDIGRASVVAIALTIGLCLLFTAAAVYAAVDAADTMTAVIGVFFAVVFGLGLLVALLALPKVVKPRGFVFDGDGIHHWRGDAWTLVPWAEVAAVGIGYDQPPEAPSVPLSIEDAVKNYVTDKAKEAMRLDSKRRFGMEIFPTGTEVLAKYPALAMYRRELPSVPAAGLPHTRWRVPLPPILGVVATVERGARAHREQAWIGWFARPWKRF